MRLALFGPPGSGKGTQASILKDRHSLEHLSTGNMLRAARDAGTAVGLEAKRYLDQGELVPDGIVWKIAREALVECGFDDFVLDGFPRTLRQAEWLDRDIQRAGGGLKVISLEVSDNVILKRLSKRRIHRVTGEVYHLENNPPPDDVDPADLIQRADDKPQAVRLRLEVYERETAPIKDHYTRLGALIEVDGAGDVQTVAGRIAQALSS